MTNQSLLDKIKGYFPQQKIINKTIEPKEEELNFKPRPLNSIESDDNDEELQPTEEKEEFIFHDLRKAKRTKERGFPDGKREWKNVKGITLHQMAVHIQKPETCINIPCHGSVIKNADIVLLNDPNLIMSHGHALNKWDIGVEISGREPGVIGEPKSFGLSKDERAAGKTYDDLFRPVSERQIQAAIHLCEYYINLVAEHGGKIEFIHAHRQGDDSRVSDPGEKIWKGVAIPLMKKYGLSCGPIGWRVGDGTPIPQIWDEVNGKGIEYSWKVKGF
jgi:hypothetical protein